MESIAIKKFLDFAESMKLVRNDVVENNGKKIIEEIYTDLLPNNGVINKVVLPRTTVLIGRKGTGKSTIFQKAQIELDKNRKYLTIYIDVKSLYENSTPSIQEGLDQLKGFSELNKYLIYSNFIKEIILKTKEKLKSKVETNKITKIFGVSDIVYSDIFEELDKIESSIEDVFKTVNASMIHSFKNTQNTSTERNDSLDLDIKTDKLGIKLSGSENQSNSLKREFENTLVTYLDIKNCFIKNIIRIKELLDLKNIYIFLDDYSEIKREAQVLFMDWFIAPVNNLSDDCVKFKIATYPKRFIYGKLDNGKIDEISLDFFDAFYNFEQKSNAKDISRMEHLALDYTKRLIENRMAIYLGEDYWNELFEMTKDELYEILFIATLNIPRKMGYILSYCYESCLIHGTKINIRSIENAANRYYNDVTEKFFLVNEHICKPFFDNITNNYQYELLEKIVERQINNREFLSRKKYKDTSHFYLSSDIAYLLDNLELNGFVSTYNKIKIEHNLFSTVYCLDLGLCKRFDLEFGKPDNPKANCHTLDPKFNFSVLITEYFNSTQVIRCEFGHEFPYNDYEQIKKFGMNCPTCVQDRVFSKCQVQMKFNDLRSSFLKQEENEKFRISFQEYLILDFLKVSQNGVSVEKIAATQDLALATINKNIERLTKNGWSEYDVVAGKKLGKDVYKITSKGVRLTEKIDEHIKSYRVEIETVNLK